MSNPFLDKVIENIDKPIMTHAEIRQAYWRNKPPLKKPSGVKQFKDTIAKKNKPITQALEDALDEGQAVDVVEHHELCARDNCDGQCQERGTTFQDFISGARVVVRHRTR